jgi:glutamate 5-kinase
VNTRADLPAARRVVVKVGSRVLADQDSLIQRLAGEVNEQRQHRRSFVLVSSGAIALGSQRLGYAKRPTEVARLQAAAAAGQSVLMRRYDVAFAALGMTAAQVLLTHADLAERDRMNNARNAFAALLDAGAVPIVNENDTVSTEELRFGDNDQLAAMVAPLVDADLLVLLTDVDGVMDERGDRISVMADGQSIGTVAPSSARVGTGGIASKIDAARKGSRSGADVVIAPASRVGVLGDILSGKEVGTLFPRAGSPLRARHHWIAFTLRPRGALLLDEGAVKAVTSGRVSLLPVGVLGVRGAFGAGDPVRLMAPDGREIGRGLARLSAPDAARAAGKKGDELAVELGPGFSDQVLVHKDDLVLSE